MGDFLSMFIIFLFTPFFWISVVLLVVWIVILCYLKQKANPKLRVFLNVIGSVIGILIIIVFPLTVTILIKFSYPISFM